MPSREHHLRQAKLNNTVFSMIGLQNSQGSMASNSHINLALETATHCFEAILPIASPIINKRRKKNAHILEHYDTYEDRLTAMKCVPEFQDIALPYIAIRGIVKIAEYKNTTETIGSLIRRLSEFDLECEKALAKIRKAAKT